MQYLERLFRWSIRNLRTTGRDRDLRSEVDYWKTWFATKGFEWPQDYVERLDPNLPIQDWIAPYLDRLHGDEVEVLDVGSGPLTKLGKVHPSKRLSITAVDQLADEYNAIIDSYGLHPPIRTQSCNAEKLTETFGNRRFDVVHAENSMDHANDAVAALREMFAMTKTGGLLLLVHAEHEGKNQNYAGLHKWDFTHEDGHFIVSGPGSSGLRHDMTEYFSHKAEIECWVHDGGVYVAMHKNSAA